MQKIKDLWQENKILLSLIIILIICFVLIIFVFVTHFFGGSASSYGDRLKDLNKHAYTQKHESKYKDLVLKEEIVSKVKIKSIGRIIYVKISFEPDVTLDEAKSVALASLQEIKEKHLEYYDFIFTIEGFPTENSDGFLLMGSKNKNTKIITWNNNTTIEKGEDDEEK